MPTVVAAVVRGRRAFSGGAAAHVVGDEGGRRDGPPQPFGCRAVMIAHVRTRLSRRSGAQLSAADSDICR
jgi:hypothetical protein